MAARKTSAQEPEQVDPATVHLTPEDLAARLQLALVTLSKWRQQGKGPPYMRVARSGVRYILADVIAWEAALTVQPNPEPPP